MLLVKPHGKLRKVRSKGLLEGFILLNERTPTALNTITDNSKIAESIIKGFLPLIPNIVSLNASTAFVTRSRVVKVESHPGRF